MNRYVTYSRVSTEEQGADGHSLGGQTAQLRAYVEARGGEVHRAFEEVASGTDDGRPALHEALNLAWLTHSKLLVVRSDRLSRNDGFVEYLRGDKRYADLIEMAEGDSSATERRVNSFVSSIERIMISQRTREGLAAAKAKGVKLGAARKGSPGRPFTAADAAVGTRLSADSKMRDADQWAESMLRELDRIGGSDLKLWAAASLLNRSGFSTRQGAAFTATTVSKLRTRGRIIAAREAS